MFTIDIPPALPQQDTMLVAQANVTNPQTKFDYVLKACEEVEQEGDPGAQQGGANNILEPELWLSYQIPKSTPEQIRPAIRLVQTATKGKILEIAYSKGVCDSQGRNCNYSDIYKNADGSSPVMPENSGNVIYESHTNGMFYYKPTPGYLGKDQAIFSAEYKGKRYKIVLDIIVSPSVNQSDEPGPCPAGGGTLIKVKTNISFGDLLDREPKSWVTKSV